MLFHCFISYLYMCVLKLTLGNFCSAYFPLFFQLVVWSVWMDMFLHLDALDSVDLLSDSMLSWRVCTTSGRKLFAFFAKHTTFCLFYHVVLCVFSLGLIPRFWYSLHIFSHFQVFPLSFFILLRFALVLFRILESLIDYGLRDCAWISSFVFMLDGYY
jgi:hypothetical protein